MTLYVESNFVLEIALGQEESSAAERLLAASEAGRILLAIPSLSLGEPFPWLTKTKRDRTRVMRQLTGQVDQIERSAPHQAEVVHLRAVPDLMETINKREVDRLETTVTRLLACARQLPLSGAAFRDALARKAQFETIEDAIVLATVIADLHASGRSLHRHIFANRNRKDFSNPFIAGELHQLNCDLEFSFTETVRRLGI